MKIGTLVPLWLSVSFCVLAIATPSAEWIREGVGIIPVQRLIQNLERRLRSDRRNADLLTIWAHCASVTRTLGLGTSTSTQRSTAAIG